VSVQRRRANARQIFEAYCQVQLGEGEHTPEQMWNKSTINERTKDVIFLYASTATGKIGEKPKAGVLFQLKDALWWWIQRFIKDSLSIYGSWHSYNISAIHKAALMYDFETGWLEKNNLTDAELTLFWAAIEKPKKSMVNLENYKQHYVAWLLMWVTSTRPGAITVGYGFEAGSLIAQGKKRGDDETMRWKDLEFFRLPEEAGGGIGIKGLFRFQKGFRVPHQQKQIVGERKFSVFPLQSDRYHLDLALVLTALAFSRGLFHYKSLQELFDDNTVNIPQVESVSKQAVLLASDSAGITTSRKPMHENSLNPKLREMCDLVGLFARNTVYSFRRGAIVDHRRKLGTERAQELAGHAMQGNAIYSYDDTGLVELDLANTRAGSKATDEAYIREMFSQANSKRFDLDDREVAATASIPILGEGRQGIAIRAAALQVVNADPQVQELADTVDQAYNEGRQLAISKGVDADLMSNYMDIVDQLNALLTSGNPDCQLALDAINDAKAEAKKARRIATRSAKKDARATLLADAKKNQTLARTGNRAGSRGQSTHLERAAIATADQSSGFDRQVEEIEAFDPDVDEDEVEGDDQDPGGSANQGDENDLWNGVAEGAEVTFASKPDEDGPKYTKAGRLEFAKKFLVVQARPNKGLTCLLCAEDPTVPYEKKDQKYTASKLDEHLKGNYHSREKEISRAFHIDAVGQPPKAVCPLCKVSFVMKGYLSHVREKHGNQFFYE
jgi:hypothetical protein